MRTAVLSVFGSLILIMPFSCESPAWDSIVDQFMPEDMVERAPEVYQGYEFDDVVFTRENFYNNSAGMRQHRRTTIAPGKNLRFEALNPVDDEPAPKTKIIEKDGKAVTTISIGKDSKDESESQ